MAEIQWNRSQRQIDILNQFLRLVNSNREKHAIFSTMVEGSVEMLEAEAGTIALIDRDDPSQLVFTYTAGKVADTLRGTRFPVGQGIIGWAVENDLPLFVNDIKNDPRFSGITDKASGFSTGTVVCAPIKSNGKIIGAIEVLNKKKGGFSDSDLNLLEMVVNIAGLAFASTDKISKDQKAPAKKPESTKPEKQKSDPALARLRAQHNAIFEGTSEGIMTISVDAVITSANRAFLLFLKKNRKDVVDKKCHELFFNNKKPCQGCIIDDIIGGANDIPAKRLCREITIAGRTFTTTASTLNVEKKAIPSLLLTARDTSLLDKQVLLLKVATSAAIRLLLAKEPQTKVGGLLAELGKTSGASRCYWFKNTIKPDGRVVARQVTEWCAKGESSQLKDPKLEKTTYPKRWLKKFTKGWYVAETESSSPDNAISEFKSPDIQSFLLIPILINGNFEGIIGFDNCKAMVPWRPAEASILRFGVNAFARALEQEKTGKGKEKKQQELKEFQRQQKLIQQNELEKQQLLEKEIKEQQKQHKLAQEKEVEKHQKQQKQIQELSGQLKDINKQRDQQIEVLNKQDQQIELLKKQDQEKEKKGEKSQKKITEEKKEQDKEIQKLQKQRDQQIEVLKKQEEQIEFLKKQEQKDDPGKNKEQEKQIQKLSDQLNDIQKQRDQQKEELKKQEQQIELLKKQEQKGGSGKNNDQGKELQKLQKQLEKIKKQRDYQKETLDLQDRQIVLLKKQERQNEQLEEQANNSIAQERIALSQHMEVMGQIVSGIAHNFRNVLSGIAANAQLIQMKHGGLEGIDRQTDALLDLTTMGSDLISSILQYSKTESGSARNVFDITHLLRETYQIISKVFDKHISPQRSFSDPLPVYGNRSELGQVFMNLCTNARDAMPDGGQLSIEAKKQGDNIHVAISDTGQGMDDATVEKIFEPFFTTKESGKGTGLGLSTAHTIVKDHDGEIRVKSKAGAGTTFTVVLPFSPKMLEIKDQPETGIIHGNNEKLLVVDDDLSLLGPLEDLLKGIGYEILSVSTAKDAISKFSDWNPDLVLLDRNMPDMKGNEVAEEMLSQNPDVKIILMSGYDKTGPDGLDEKIEKQISGYITKPLDLPVVSHALAQALKNQPDD